MIIAMQNTVSELCTFRCALKDMNRLTPAELSWPGASYRFPLVLRNSARHNHTRIPSPLHFSANPRKQSPNKPDSHTSLFMAFETTQIRQYPFPIYTCTVPCRTDWPFKSAKYPWSTSFHLHTHTYPNNVPASQSGAIPCRPSGPGQKGMGTHPPSISESILTALFSSPVDAPCSSKTDLCCGDDMTDSEGRGKDAAAGAWLQLMHTNAINSN